MVEFRGGDRMIAALRKISDKISQPATLRVGFLEGATAPNGDSIPTRAALNEFGHGSTPPRPFFRTMVAEKSPTWGDAVEKNLVRSDYNVTQTLDIVGEGIKGQLQQSIVNLTSPPLAASTIKKKGFDKPLIDHGDMLRAVDFEVKS